MREEGNIQKLQRIVKKYWAINKSASQYMGNEMDSLKEDTQMINNYF